ncbi:phosphinothricin acetyltransferase [Chitinasiproducens palmae]|uniref:Phosphinothricin acetyltransferase n=2 Tax=Chitinasiproducens palmae TaxID=1770053 RepID=A0A1H2PP18_9BURK|nr:phosphinothricin acetyltransferase [Chitinasiproducens palmae]
MPSVQAIYAHYVERSPFTFEEQVPDLVEMRRRRAEVGAAGLPYLVAERDGMVVGYAYATRYRQRSAYRFTAEHSVYVAPERRAGGAGRALLVALLRACRERGVAQLIAVVGGGMRNPASLAVHRALGFEMVGTLSRVGYKFGEWLDTTLMQRSLDDLG